jgi:hypothetical protein
MKVETDKIASIIVCPIGRNATQFMMYVDTFNINVIVLSIMS